MLLMFILFLMIEEGQHVILTTNTDEHRFAVASKTGSTKLRKNTVRTGGLVGARWGSFFEVKKDNLVPASRKRLAESTAP